MNSTSKHYIYKSDIWLTVHRNSVWIINQLDVIFVLSFISPLQVSPQWTHYLLTGSDSLPTATAQYQHVAITLISRQLLKMGTWLSETC